METYRIFGKRMLLMIAIMVSFNIILYLKAEHNSRNDIFASQQFATEVLNSCKEMNPEQQQSYIEQQQHLYQSVQDMMLFPDLAQEAYVQEYAEEHVEDTTLAEDLTIEQVEDRLKELAYLSEAIQHIVQYHENMESIEGDADKKSAISIYADQESYSAREKKKSVSDFNRLKSVEVDLGNDKPVISMMNRTETAYVLLILLFAVVIAFFDERKRGLWLSVYAMKYGRGRLALKRCMILMGTDVFFTALLYGSNYILACVLYGQPDYMRSIQSIPMFGNFVVPVNIGMFFALFFVVRILTAFGISCFIWAVLSVAESRNIGLMVILVVFSIEYALYRFIQPQGVLNLLKYMNMIYLIHPDDLFLYYRNLRLFFHPAGRLELTACILGIGIPALILMITVSAVLRRPVQKISLLGKLFSSVAEKFQHILSHFPQGCLEVYKLLLKQKGIVIIAVFLVVLFASYEPPQYTYKESTSYLKDFYDQCSGKTVEEANAYIQKFESELNEQIKNEGITDRVRMEKSALYAMEERIEYVQDKIDQGIQVEIVDDTGITRTLKNAEKKNLSHMLIAIAMIFLASGVFQYEQKCHMNNMLIAAKGRERLFWQKIMIVAVILLCLMTASYGLQWYSFFVQYGGDAVSAPVHSIPILENVPFSCSVAVLIIGLVVYRIVLMASVLAMVIVCSFYIGQEKAIILSVIVFIIPAALVYMGVEIIRPVSVIEYITAYDMLVNSKGVTMFVPGVVIAGVGIAAGYKCLACWCHMNR